MEKQALYNNPLKPSGPWKYTALLESRKEAEQLHNTDNCPRKDNGRKDEIMDRSATVVAWKTFTDDNRKLQKHGTTTDLRQIWQGIIDNKITQWRRQTSQISEEIRLLARNGKLTPKLRKNRNWMRKELKDKPTKQRLKEHKEKNIN